MTERDPKVVPLFAPTVPWAWHKGTFSNALDPAPITIESLKAAVVIVRRSQLRLVRGGR